jgi:hypothetical protein
MFDIGNERADKPEMFDVLLGDKTIVDVISHAVGIFFEEELFADRPVLKREYLK